MNSNISDNIKRIRDEVATLAVLSGRKPEDITLVAASKTRTADEVQQAILSGVDAVGENRVQEMLAKHTQYAYVGAPLHFIGTLQSNKVRQIVGVCDLIESVDSTALIELIGKKAMSLGIVQNILIEVNIGRESQKSGILPEALDDVFGLIAQTEGVFALGLMAIPPFCDEIERNCNYFDAMMKLFVDIKAKKYDNTAVRLLSMGMSDSYADAIRAGSNMIRIGSAIFGLR
ncbi:MAG: YggS family pyridoxal phosphate-dependent enzyme [Oscillospiraceae bacterium]|nr:YggS family pyridoxal phosphate-dependent enzyme [Oscillospiraceae bacterium]